MQTCEGCGNSYEDCFEVVMDGKRHVFDSFECAIATLAPTCPHCGCRVLGHGIQVDDRVYCCAHCSRAHGVRGANDHVEDAVLKAAGVA